MPEEYMSVVVWEEWRFVAIGTRQPRRRVYYVKRGEVEEASMPAASVKFDDA